MSLEDINSIVIGMAAAWNSGDIDQFLGFLTEDVEWIDPAMQIPAKGVAEVKKFANSMRSAFPDFQYTIRHPICIAADRSRCTVPWHITGTHRKILDPPGFGPTNRHVSFSGIDLFEFRGLKVFRIETCFDVIGPAEQLMSMTLRPPVGGLRERIVVFLQRIRAFWLRRVTPGVKDQLKEQKHINGSH